MTVSSSTNRVAYNGNGTTTAFAFPYLFYADGDLTVILVSSTGAETVQTITTHYTVTGAGNSGGGTVTMLTAPASGAKLVILREVDYTQELDLVDNDPLPANSVEAVLDQQVMMAQQLKEVTDRAIRFPRGDSSALTSELPAAILRTSRYLGFDASGNITTLDGLGTWEGTWATATAYVVGDIIKDGAAGANTGNLYRCSVAHTSGTWATDLAAPRWELLIDYAAAYAAQLAAEAAAVSTAADRVQTGLDAAATAADAIATAADAVATAADRVQTGLDAAATAADAVATAADRVQTGLDAAAAAASASAADVAKIEWKGAWLTATAYALNDAVSEAGSSYICISAHTSGTFATDLAALKWEVLAQKGTDGSGSGDVTGPASSVAGRLATFADASGKVLADSGYDPTDFATASQGSKADGAAQKSANLSDLANAATARTNLGLGTVATKAISDAASTVVAGVTGTFTAGNLAVFADTAGTIEDGGSAPTGAVTAKVVSSTSDTALATVAAGGSAIATWAGRTVAAGDVFATVILQAEYDSDTTDASYMYGLKIGSDAVKWPSSDDGNGTDTKLLDGVVNAGITNVIRGFGFNNGQAQPAIRFYSVDALGITTGTGKDVVLYAGDQASALTGGITVAGTTTPFYALILHITGA